MPSRCPNPRASVAALPSLYCCPQNTKHNRDPQLLSSAMYFQQFTFHRAYFFTSQRFTLLPAILYQKRTLSGNLQSSKCRYSNCNVSLCNPKSCAITQAVSRRFSTARARTQFQVSPCEYVLDRVTIVRVFPEYFSFPLSVSSSSARCAYQKDKWAKTWNSQKSQARWKSTVTLTLKD